MPCVWRRSPNGSREPVGRSPAIEQRRRCVSSLSASDTAAHVTAASPSCAVRRRRVGLDADRQVVVVDRLPHLLGLPFLARVDAAHRPLQLGELADHVGGRGRPSPAAPAVAACSAASGCPNTSLGNPSRQRARSARPSRDSSRASCGTSSVCSRSSRDSSVDLPIGVPEEPRVAQPRRDHALGVPRDHPLVGRPRVDDREERLLQLAASRRRTGK